MKSYILIVIITAFFMTSCSKKGDLKKTDQKSATVNENKAAPSEAYTLFKNTCYACHSVTSKSHDEIIAPPMVAVKRRYKNNYLSKEDFVKAIVNWAKDPKEENALMKGAVQQFKVMPKQAFKEEDLKKIAAYIYDNQIEQPEWFEAHYKEMHGGESKGMGMQGQNNWKMQMNLYAGKKWDANIETTQGVEKLQQIMSNDTSQSIDDFQNLEKKLSDELAIIFDKCTMKGASHDNLHTFLLPLIKKVDKLKEISSVEQGKMISSKISTHLSEYKNFFK